MNWLKRLYDWVLHWADTPYGAPALFIFAFVESSFFSITTGCSSDRAGTGGPTQSVVFRGDMHRRIGVGSVVRLFDRLANVRFSGETDSGILRSAPTGWTDHRSCDRRNGQSYGLVSKIRRLDYLCRGVDPNSLQNHHYRSRFMPGQYSDIHIDQYCGPGIAFFLRWAESCGMAANPPKSLSTSISICWRSHLSCC